MHADKQFRKELMSLAIPFALQWLLNALVGASDALMLGRLTQESIAAVSLANQVSFVLSLFIGAIVGAIGVLVAQYYGKGDFDTVRNLLSMALRYVLVLTVIFFLLAFFLPEHLMTVFTDEQDLIAIGASYLRIVSFSYLFQGASQCYLMLMKVDGRAKVSVWISAVTVVVDMTADYFLIYGAGKLPALGANGSAYSTIAVEVIALCWCVAASYQKGRIHPNSRSLRFFSPRLEKDMLRIAFPMLASSLSWGLSIVAHSVIIGHMGTDATAAYSVTNVATSLIQCLSQGFANGAGVMLGTLLGQNLFEKAKEYGKRSVLYLATAIPIDDDMKERIRMHQERRDPEWGTYEGYRDLGEVVKNTEKNTILLDCVTVMITNILFEEEERDFDKISASEVEKLESEVIKELTNLVKAIRDEDKTLIIVSNEVGMSIVPSYRLGRIFSDISGKANQVLASLSDEVYVAISGLPLRLK